MCVFSFLFVQEAEFHIIPKGLYIITGKSFIYYLLQGMLEQEIVYSPCTAGH